MLLSPQTIRAGWSCRRLPERLNAEVSSRLAFTRTAEFCWMPGCTRAIVTCLTAGGAPVRANATGPAEITIAVAAAPRMRRPAEPEIKTMTMPVFAATIAKLTSHTPPMAASASTAGCCHWLAPRTAHGPPSACQDRIHSVTSQKLGHLFDPANDAHFVVGIGSRDRVV